MTTGSLNIYVKKQQSGAVMLITLLFLLLLTLLGASSLYLAFIETVLARSIESDARAFYKAESGIERALYWFSRPDNFSGLPDDFFSKRQINNTSFFDEDGVSQYSGTSQNPDLVFATEDYVIAVYGPATPGALCSVASTAISGRIRRRVTVEFYEYLAGVRPLPGTWYTD